MLRDRNYIPVHEEERNSGVFNEIHVSRVRRRDICGAPLNELNNSVILFSPVENLIGPAQGTGRY